MPTCSWTLGNESPKTIRALLSSSVRSEGGLDDRLRPILEEIDGSCDGVRAKDSRGELRPLSFKKAQALACFLRCLLYVSKRLFGFSERLVELIEGSFERLSGVIDFAEIDLSIDLNAAN